MRNRLNKIAESIFGFIEAEKPLYPLLFFRMGLSLICFGKFFVLYSNYLNFYGQYGLIQWTISKLSNYSFLPHIGDLALLLSKYLHLSPDRSAELVLQLFFCTCLFLFLGLFTRLASILCFFLHLTFINTGNGMIYGVDVFTQISLFYAMFFPLSSVCSLDAVIGISKVKEKSVAAGISIRVIQIQLCIVYLSTGIEKCLGEQWLNGEAIWRTLMMPVFKNYNFYWIAGFPHIPYFLGIIVLIIELGYTFFMWRKNIRVLWLFLIISLHFNIGLLMGMWYFAFIMIFLSVFAFGDDVISDINSYRRNRTLKSFNAVRRESVSI
jgi:hypothetical protein